jgi:hypothetical protein
VGDTIRFGQSSRLYVLTGPAELMPQEGLSKQQQKQLKLLEAAQVRDVTGHVSNMSLAHSNTSQDADAVADKAGTMWLHLTARERM